MKKLKIEHLAPYSPYEIQGYHLEYKKYWAELCPANIGWFTESTHFMKIVLHPLSDITKEIEVSGEKFVPVDRIFKGWKTDKSMKLWWYETELKLSCGNYELVDFGIIQKLFEYHFDVFGLIENNLAININDL